MATASPLNIEVHVELTAPARYLAKALELLDTSHRYRPGSDGQLASLAEAQVYATLATIPAAPAQPAAKAAPRKSTPAPKKEPQK